MGYIPYRSDKKLWPGLCSLAGKGAKAWDCETQSTSFQRLCVCTNPQTATTGAG